MEPSWTGLVAFSESGESLLPLSFPLPREDTAGRQWSASQEEALARDRPHCTLVLDLQLPEL